MLVLTRKLMEKLYIGENICITVVRLEGGQVRLGIEAPREIAVVRAELVPERNAGPNRPGVAPGARVAGPIHGHHSTPGASPKAPVGGRAEDGVRIPQAAAHGIGNRRRGPSR